MSDTTPQVLRAPKLFWQTRRLDGHRDWPFAFWRELFQNSVDAKARNIEISIRRVARSGVFDRTSPGGEVVQVLFADDGTGMTEDTIRNVFLEPGRSTKGNGSGMIGGFGTARTLLCFSQDRYEIHTNGLVVEGDGSEYILSKREDAERRASTHGLERFAANIERFGGRKGCAFVIDVDPNESEYSWRNVNEHQLRRKLFEFLDMSDLKLDGITLDGEKLVADLKKGQARTRLSAPGFPDFGTVHVSRNDKAVQRGFAIARVNGLAMFRERVELDDVQIILELDAARTRHLLTDNRDGLKDAPDMALREFVRDLTVNRREALRDKSGDKEWTLEGELGDVPVKPEKIELVGLPSASDGTNEAEPSSRRGLRLPEENTVPSSGSAGREDGAGGTAKRGEGVPGIHDFHMHAEGIKGNPVLENAARRWQPKYWRKQGESLAGRGRESHELLAAWTAACANALGYVAALRPQLLISERRDAIPFVPGFVISGRDAEGRIGGLHKKLVDGRHALLVNPILQDGSIAYDLRRLRDGDGKFGLQTLVHIAIHEACHVIGRSHNDEFANLLTSVSARLDYAKMSREMLEKINSVRALYGAKEARIQVFEELAALRTVIEGGGVEAGRTGRGRRHRPAEQALAAAWPVGVAVSGALAAPDNQALPADAVREALAQAIIPVTETEMAIHTEILGRIDDELAKAARSDWTPPASIDWSGLEPDAAEPVETAAKSPTQDEQDILDLDLGNLRLEMTAPVLEPSEPSMPAGDELDLDLGALPLEAQETSVQANLEQLIENAARENVHPQAEVGQPAGPGASHEGSTRFPSSLSVNDIIDDDSNSLDGDFRP